MSEQWSVGGPRVIEVGGADEPVRQLVIAVIAGRVDVVAHDQDEARVEVGEVRGRDLEVAWDDGVLSISHPQLRWDSLLEGLRGLGRREDSAEISIAVPRGTTVQLGTVSADGLLAGVQSPAAVRTVSGSLVLDGVHGAVSARTVSGRIDVRDQHGPLSGESVSGSLTVHGVDLPELDVKTVSGALAVDLHGSPSRIRCKSVSGDLTVRIPATAGFRLTAKTVSGRVVADGRHIGERRPGRTKGEVRDGDESVQIDAGSVSGDVTVLRPSARSYDDAGVTA